MKMKRILSFLVLTIALFSLMACKNNSDVIINDDGTVTEIFSFFQGIPEDTSFYDNYSDNPVLQYLETKIWNQDDEGRDVRIQFDFSSTIIGQETNITNTLISTGTYSDVMDMSHYTGSVIDLYNEGILLDITYYVENYMPNYLAFLDQHPELKQFASVNIDGEQKYIYIQGYQDYAEPYWGYQYRRDWIVKYADEVHGIDPFSRWTDEDGNYNDDVIFPNGTIDPLYISDWEWMFEIFDYALDAEGIQDGYVTSLFYPGYIERGDLIPNSGSFYITPDNEIEFAPTTEGFRSYLQMVNTWWDKGWIDTHFAERTSELFYQTGTNYFMTGRVGLWYGGTYAQDDSLSTGLPNSAENGYTEDIFVWTAPQPINDMYGDESTRNIEPYTYYLPTLEQVQYAITEKASDKDLVALFTFLDYTFSEEGSIMSTFGLNEEQYAEIDNDFENTFNLSGGNYTVVDVDGVQKYQFIDDLSQDDKLKNAAIMNRFFSLHSKSKTHYDYTKTKQHSMDQIAKYLVTGELSISMLAQLHPDDSETLAKTTTNLRSFLQRNIPDFVMGNSDPFSDNDWEMYVNAVNKYNPDACVQFLQELLDKYTD